MDSIQYIVPIFFLLALGAVAQGQFTDDFSDLDFTNNPTWEGDQSKFTVNADSQLQLNNAAVTDEAILYTQVDLQDTVTWEFYYRMDFNPSGSNYLKVFLSTNTAPTQSEYEGFFLRTGESGSDDAIELYEKTASGEELILRGEDGIFAEEPEGNIKIQVADGEWEIWVDTAMDGNYSSQGTVTGYPLSLGRFFGVACGHTSTRADKFFFDDFYIAPIYQDTTPPDVASVAVLNDSMLRVDYSEPVDTQTALDASNYQLVNSTIQVSKVQEDPQEVAAYLLNFSSSFQNKTAYEISISGIADKAGNVMDAVQLPFTNFVPEVGDLQFTELFPDPSPPVALPEQEFVEIYNASNYAINLEHIEFSDSRDTVNLPSMELAAGEYIIVCDDDHKAAFSTFGPVAPVTSLPTLNNGEDELTLFYKENSVLDFVNYSSDWYRDDNKAAGGWTLERIEEAICDGEAAWIASFDSDGGTPGRENSTAEEFTDTTAPAIASVEISQQRDSIWITFTEPLAAKPDSVAISGLSYATSMAAIDEINFLAVFDNGFEQGESYNLFILGVEDCYGNQASLNEPIIQPFIPQKGDLLINEVLFNPASGGVDYVEIYNNSEKVLSLNGMQIIERDAVTNDLEDVALIEEMEVFMEPGSFFVFTSDPENIVRSYEVKHPNWLFELNDLPNYPDDAGIVTIARDTFATLDSLAYFSDWHYDLLSDENGVSLERVSHDGSTTDPGNWFSASEASGFGTPTYQNSQFYAQLQPEGEITIDPEVFSPNQDGYRDQVNITLAFDEPGYTATIQVFDARGRFVRELENNLLLASETHVRWDGINHEGSKAQPGIYVLYFKIFNANGASFVEKKKCVLAERR